MIVGVKDSLKLFGITIITFCAVFVCTLFLNYNMDIVSIKPKITEGQMTVVYNALVSNSKVVCAVSGLCLLLTSVIMLIFHVKHYIDTHRKELGILKAMGYSAFAVSAHFWVFGLSVLVGTAAGFAGAHALMPTFYAVQNEDNLLPAFDFTFHPVLLVVLVVVPTVFFALLACVYARYKLRQPSIILLKDADEPKKHFKIRNNSNKVRRFLRGSGTKTPKERSFLRDLTIQTLKSRKILVFFIIFSAFCFSAMTQMSFSMKDLASELMGAMILVIGLVLAFTTLFISVSTCLNGNKKSIALMKVMGYSNSQCATAILSGYRLFAYLGFAIGTGYQYGLLRAMIDLVFKDYENLPEYNFDWKAMLITLAVFIVVYEGITLLYSRRISKISIKQIMLE